MEINVGTPDILFPPEAMELLKVDQVARKCSKNSIILMPAFLCSTVEEEVDLLNRFLYEYLDIRQQQCISKNLTILPLALLEYIEKIDRVVNTYRKERELVPEKYIAVYFSLWEDRKGYICISTMLHSFPNDPGTNYYKGYHATSSNNVGGNNGSSNTSGTTGV